jgi:uncharacterized membrane protein YeiH
MRLVFVVGTIAFALSGYLLGVRKRLDLLGLVLVATLTAVGGGILRDLLLGRVPRIFVSSGPIYERPPTLIAITLVAAYALSLHRVRAKGPRSLFALADSMGLVAFSLAGATAALDAELNLFAVASIALVTAVGGGLVRDALVNEVPVILHEDVYGTIAILLALGLAGARRLDIDDDLSLPVLFFVGLLVRLYAINGRLRLPRVRDADETP